MHNYPDERNQRALWNYADVRKLIKGLLDNMNMGILTRKNLRQKAEDLLLSNSDYWLSYAGVALIGWLLNDQKLARQGLQRALNLDDSRTSLFFLLISIREKRPYAAAKWQERYLSEQNPLGLNSNFVCFMNVYVAGLLDAADEKRTENILSEWQQQQEENPDIANTILNQWKRWFYEEKDAIQLKPEEQFRQLAEQGSVDTKEFLQRAHLPEVAVKEFRKIIQTPYKQKETKEEISLYLYEFIENDRSDSEKKSEKPDLTYAEIFLKEDSEQRSFAYGELLSEWVLEPKRYGASVATRQYALSAIKMWIRAAADDIHGETILNFPKKIDFHMKLESYTGHTAPFDFSSSDGMNEKEIIHQLQSIIGPWEQEELDKNRPGWKVFVLLAAILGGGATLIWGGSWVINNHPFILLALIALIFIWMMGLIYGLVVTAILAFIISLIINALSAVYAAHTTACVLGIAIILFFLSVRLFHQTIGNRRAIKKAFLQYTNNRKQEICACMAEVADFHDFYTKNIKKQEELRDFLEGLQIKNFVRHRHTTGRRIRV